MSTSSDGLAAALKSSPENVPLRKLLLEALWKEYDFQQVFDVAKKGVEIAPKDREIKLYLAKSAYHTDRTDVGMIVLEELMQDHPDPETSLWYSKFLAAEGQNEKAKEYYQQAVREDESVKNDDLEELLYEVDMSGAENDFPINDLIERPKIGFDDVGGMESVKEEIKMKIILPMQDPDLFKAYGRSAGGGLMLYGPPGCGKTFIARAAAGEADASFIAVGINEIFDLYLGESEKNLHRIFDQARRNTPCILFFDEIDALGAHRSKMRGGAGKNVINQFLAEMDNVKESNEGILIIGATNTPWDVDPAFRRPGRFDSVVFVPPPDVEARKAILEIMLKGKPVLNVDHQKIAEKAKEFSGADIKGLVEKALDDKLRQSVKTGELERVSEKDLLKALKKQKPTTKEWFSVARNYATYSNAGGQFDDILKYLKLI